MKKVLYLFLMTIVTNVNAQIVEGKYDLIKKEYLGSKGFVVETITGNCVVDSVWQMGQVYSCESLRVLDNNKIYFSTFRSFDTGNTLSSRGGDYLVELTPVAENCYEAKTELIAMKVTIINDYELEIFVHNRIIFRNIRGIMNRTECLPVYENTKYLFKRNEVENGDTISITETSLEKHYKSFGINYGGYRVIGSEIIFEDQTNWSGKKEVRKIKQPDINTFEVLTHNYREFFLIKSTSHMSFPSGYTDYAKDINHVYFQGEIIKDANTNEFQIIDPLHAKTSKNVYFKNTIIPNADINTFKSLNGGYTKDKNNYYREGIVVKKNKDIRWLLSRKQKK